MEPLYPDNPSRSDRTKSSLFTLLKKLDMERGGGGEKEMERLFASTMRGQKER